VARKSGSNKDILKLLREIELKLTNGSDVQSACRGVGISDATYYHRRKRFGGMGCDLSLTRAPIEPAEDIVLIAVNAAHMLGLPLNGQFVELGGSFVCEDRIAPYYRLYSLEDFSPIRPGMMRVADPTNGSSIALEVWALPTSSVGDLLMQIPAPLGLGTLELESGDTVKGFICEAAAAASAKDITAHGGWRTYPTTLR